MEHIVEIELTLNEGVLIATPSRSTVPRGATVVWIFKGDDLVNQRLEVRRKDTPPGAQPFSEKPANSNEAKGQPFPIGGTESSFRYEIVTSEGKVLPWADGSNGEDFVPEDPPRRR